MNERVIIRILRILLNSASSHHNEITALNALLQAKGILSENELEEAVAYIEAHSAVEQVVDPETRAAMEEEINRIEGEESRPDDK